MPTIVRLAAAMLVAAAPLAAQQPGDHVRIAPVARTGDQYAPLRHAGTLERADIDSVIVHDGAQRVALATRDVRRFELRTDTRPRGRAAVRWGAAGAVLGTAVGGMVAATALGDQECPAAVGYRCDGDRGGDRWRAVGYGALAGAAVGALYGSKFAWASWRTVDLPGGGRVGFAILPSAAAVTVAR